MAGHCGGVQRLLQERENRRIPYVHCCLNHQLHLVVVHAMSVEQAINDFLHVCGSLQFFHKSTAALYNNGEKLKNLLEQSWTSHLATVTGVINSLKRVQGWLCKFKYISQ